MGDYTYTGLEASQPEAKSGAGDEEGEDEDYLILDRKKLSKIIGRKNGISDSGLSRALALTYAGKKAKFVGETMDFIDRTKEGMVAEKREPKYDKLFQEYAKAMKGKSEAEIRDKIREDAEEKNAGIVMGAFDETIGSPDFYSSLNIELKMAGSKLGRADVGTESLKPEDLNEAAALYLKKVAAYGKKHGIEIEFDEKSALKTSGKSRKSAKSEVDISYA